MGVAPVDINAGAKTSAYWSMANYSHVSILVAIGNMDNAATITVTENTNSSAVGEATIGFDYYAIDGNGNTGARTTATDAGFSTGTTNNRMWVIEVDAEQLSDGKPWMAVKTTNPATSSIITIIPVLSGARYAQAKPPAAF
ncbi:MAG: hypothetical protein EA384_09130 [Spirochaetaceae bacterium]|nr:MAG: hypothetical protein EA384_09130 [Spirochaetaceae bacterium]